MLVVLPNEQECSRIGIVAGRLMGNAVRRNRTKRLMRAALQPLLLRIAPGWDMILIARQSLQRASFQQTQAALLALFEHARLFVDR